MLRLTIFAAVSALGLSGCSAAAPRLHQPDRIEAYCGDRVAIVTAIESVVASTGDAAGAAVVASDATFRRTVKDNGGVVAHWNDQPLYQPSLAKRLALSGNYVTLGDAAIGSGSTTDSRPIYLTLKTPAGSKTFALRSYDVQDVCNQGKVSS